jgi:tetratricopeptide (TPR) repeat protein
MVDYKLEVKENSGIASLSPVSSHFLPMSFWYPTPNSWFFARGADSAPFSISVAGAQSDFVTAGERSPDIGFDQKLNGQPFFAVGNWDTVSAAGTTVFVPKGSGADAQKRANELAAIATDAKTFIAPLLGPAPDEPIKIVAVRRGTGFAGGGTIFVDESVFRRPKIDSLTAMNVAEAVAKMWIGGAIGVSGDAQGAIREGLSRFIATQFIENRFGKDVADVERMRQRTAYASVARRDSPIRTVTPVDDFYFSEVANKGAMIWNLLQRKVGKDEFYKTLRDNAKDGSLEMAELRQAFSAQKDFLDYMIDQTTDMNLLVGLPQAGNGETKIALRNTGSIDATVTVTATTATGEVLSAPTTIRAVSFGDVSFKTPAKIIRAEVDSEKLYPQQDYSDDTAPREFTDSDELLAVKKTFDQQDFAGAEKNARLVLRDLPRFDDVRVLLGRALLAQNKTADAEKEFRAVLDEKLPTARAMAWADVGLGEIASRANRSSDAIKFAEDAIRSDGEYGASLAARSLRNKLNVSTPSDESIKAFFAQFDKTAVSNRKADLDTLVVPGDATKFANGISGQTEQWQTQVKQIDQLDANNVLVEANLNVKLLSRDATSGIAVFRMTKVGGEWKLSGVEMFEVR